jgi:hypothetical protein
MKEQLEKMRADNPKITEQFADLKRDLAQVRFQFHRLALQPLAEVVMSGVANGSSLRYQWYLDVAVHLVFGLLCICVVLHLA